MASSSSSALSPARSGVPDHSAALLRKAEAALISAIEIYNKPAFAYREETFAILALNAWELLFKAKLLAIKSNDCECLYIPTTKTLASKEPKQYKLTRSGNKMTIGIDACIVQLDKVGIATPEAVKKNLEAVTEIRDNAVHFFNASPQLSKQVLEIGMACVRNFIELGKLWLNLDLSGYSLYLMPIGFLPSASAATTVTLSRDEGNIVTYLAALVAQNRDAATTDYHVALDVKVSLKRASVDPNATVAITGNPNDPSVLRVHLSEESIRDQFPWDYDTLTAKLRERYSDFLQNKKYHDARRKLAKNSGYMRTRYLDPAKTNTSRMDFFNPNIVSEFDKIYTLKQQPTVPAVPPSPSPASA